MSTHDSRPLSSAYTAVIGVVATIPASIATAANIAAIAIIFAVILVLNYHNMYISIGKLSAMVSMVIH